jgi:phage-related protein
MIYFAKFMEVAYVPHAFAKTTRRTPRRDIDLAVAYYRAPVNVPTKAGVHVDLRVKAA